MPTLTNFNVTPYNDDFDENKKFHRILFRPSYAVQARELTQLQTILQNQIDRFGQHIFEQGSMVIPGDLNFDLEYYYIKVNPIYNTLIVEDYRSGYTNKIIRSHTTGLRARVIGSLPASGNDPITLYLKYEDSGDTGVVQQFGANEIFTCFNEDNTIVTNSKLTEDQTVELTAQIAEGDDAVGIGSAIQIHEGVYFINGFFVKNNQQTLILEKYSPSPSYRIGFEITENFISPEEDQSLLDNAQGTSNINAPGAHRFKIDVTLAKKSLTTTDDTSFIELARISNGVVEKFKKYADYSIIEHTLARRTYDESGNYEVRPFILETREHLDDGTNRGVFTSGNGGDSSKIIHSISPGKAYVEGYELETMTSQLVQADKPRTYDREIDTPIQTPVGNYILVENATGVPNTAQFETVNLYSRLIEDIEIADRDGSALTDIPLATASNGKPLLIGTAKVRTFMLHDGDYTGTASAIRYKLSLFNIKMNVGYSFQRDVKSFRNDDSTLTFQADIAKEFINISGLISTSTSSTTVTGIGTSFASEIDIGDYLYTSGGTKIGIVSTIVDLQTVANPTEITLEANADVALTEQGTKVLYANLVAANQNLLVFPTGYYRMRKIRGDSTSNPDNERSTQYSVMRYFEPSDVTGSGTVSFSTGDENETFDSISDLRNFLLVVDSPAVGSSNSAGDIVPIAAGDLLLPDPQQQLTIQNLSSYVGDSVRLIAAVNLQAAAANEKTKALVEDAYIIYSNRSVVENTIIRLNKADGYRLKSVKMTPNGFQDSFDSNNVVDITNRYTFDNGQRDAFYDLASIRLNPGAPVPAGPIEITFDYFTHGAGDYFSVDSYTNVIDYEDIPSYASRNGNGNVYDLRDCLDFRPRVGDDGTFTSATATLSEIPKIGTNVSADFSYYLGRIDILYLDKLGKFDLVKGVPSLNPVKPQPPDTGMVLYEIEYKPFVTNVGEITSRKLDNRRYTMRDIGKLEKRITNLEYYTSLNLLEKETAALVIKDEATGLDRLKNGFIVDNFTGHIIGDVSNPDYRIAVDMKMREGRPMAFTDNVEMVETVSLNSQRSAANYKKHKDGIITLDYEEVEYIKNPYATDSFDVNPYKVAPFTGEIILTPYSDDWKDVTRRPDITVNDDNNYDVIRQLAEAAGVMGTVWNEWQDNWYGAQVPARVETIASWNTTQSSTTVDTNIVDSSSQSWVGRNLIRTDTQSLVTNSRTTSETIQNNITRQVYTQQVGQVRSGYIGSMQSTSESHNLGDRIVSLSMIPYMRSRPISVLCNNMRPRTRIYAFFDDQNVSDYVRPADEFLLVTNASPVLNRDNFDFINIQDPGASASTDSAREYNGEQVQAFSFGDVIQNTSHTPTSVTGITVSGSTVTVTVSSSSNIRVGHHVQFSGIVSTAGSQVRYNTSGQLISSITNLNYVASRNNNYRVASVSGNTLTIVNTDDSSISNLSSNYSTGGTLTRLRASAHVSVQSPDNQADSSRMPVTIYVANIKNGFAIGDVCTGKVLNEAGSLNEIKIGGINGVTSETTLPTMNTNSTVLRTNSYGSFVGVFYLPNTETVRFRTGDRVFRLIDNINNSPEIGLHTSKAERIYRATGIAEEREQTILNLRKAEYVRDRIQDNRVVSREIRGAMQFSQSLLESTTSVVTSSNVLNQESRVIATLPPPPPRRRHDPLGQTFISQGDKGAYITKIDLFFASKGQRPVVVQLVDTFDGHPSLKIISQKILQPEDVNVSDDASVATTFVFDSPVYLKDDIEYAILIKVDEPGCRVWFSEVGQTNVTDNRVVSANPLTGTLFLSQNGSSWTPHQYRDLKFTMYRAKFNIATQGIVEFVNKSVPKQTLKSDPFEINGATIFTGRGDGSTLDFTLPFTIEDATQLYVLVDGVQDTGFTVSGNVLSFDSGNAPANSSSSDNIVVQYGTSKVRVHHLNHGFSAGDLVTISGVPDGFYGVPDGLNIGFDSDDFNTSHIVKEPVTIDSYMIDLNTSFTEFGKLVHDFVGGNEVVASRNLAADVIQPSITQIKVPDTAIEYRFTGIDKFYDRKVSNIIQENQNYYPLSRYIIGSEENQNSFLGGGRTTNIITGTSAKLTATLSSQNSFLSPMIDGQRVSLCCTSNRISNYTSSISLPEIDYRVVLLPRDFNYGADVGNDTGLAFDADLKKITALDQTISGVTKTVIKDAINSLDVGKNIIVSGTSSNDGTYHIIDIDTENGVVYVEESLVDENLTVGSTGCDVTIIQDERYLSGIAPVGTSNVANYITKRFTLANPATALKVLYEANRPSLSTINVYYKILLEGDTRTFDDIPYVLIPRDVIEPAEDNPNLFREREHTISNLPAFVTVAVKIEMKSSSTVKVPKITNLRILALAI